MIKINDIETLVDGNKRVFITARYGYALAGVALLDYVGTPYVPTLWNLFVEPAFRGKGIGRSIIEQCIVICKDNNAPAIRLAVDRTNSAAISLYKTMGFEADEEPPLGRDLILTRTINTTNKQP